MVTPIATANNNILISMAGTIQKIQNRLVSQTRETPMILARTGILLFSSVSSISHDFRKNGAIENQSYFSE